MTTWLLLGITVWITASMPFGVLFARAFALNGLPDDVPTPVPSAGPAVDRVLAGG